MQDQKVVKARYSTRGGAGQDSIKYAVHRQNEQGEAQYRTIFDREQDQLSKEQAYRRFDSERDQKERYTYTIIINPGEGRSEHLDLKQVARDTLSKLEEKGLCKNWVAVEHRDQGDHAHIHVIATSRAKLDQRDLEAMRKEQYASCERQLEPLRDLWQYRDPTPEMGESKNKSTGMAPEQETEPRTKRQISMDLDW